MKGLENSKETLDRKSKALQRFFGTIPENTGHLFSIEREALDDLIEQGVSVESVCREFVQRGFLLHGTNRANLEMLEPRQANDEGGYEENLKNGVYATSDPRIPLFVSIVKGISGRSQYSITGSIDPEHGFTESMSFTTTFDVPVDKIGYIYVLPSKTFEISGGSEQLVSNVAVQPAFVLPVTTSDFPYQIEKVKE